MMMALSKEERIELVL